MKLASVIVWTSLFLAFGCGPTTYEVRGGSLTAGTDGLITVEAIEAGNHMLSLELQHLPPPDRLVPGSTTYCMWFIPKNEPARLASIVEYDADERVGRARATTPAHEFEVRVSVEERRDVATPSEHTVLKHTIRHVD